MLAIAQRFLRVLHEELHGVITKGPLLSVICVRVAFNKERREFEVSGAHGNAKSKQQHLDKEITEYLIVLSKLVVCSQRENDKIKDV